MQIRWVLLDPAYSNPLHNVARASSELVSHDITMSTHEMMVEEDESGRVHRRYTYFENSVNVLVSVSVLNM